jgi:Cys-tRNA(Pro)/Cys-tRNA(Cys) deacylase
MVAVNNVTRFLSSRGITYAAFELPPEKLSAIEVAEALHVDAAIVFKTIVVDRQKPKRPVLVLVPASATVDLKHVADVLGEKKVHLPTEREAEALTGLQAGGISPLALLHKGFEVILDSSATSHPAIHISGGQRGLNIRLRVGDLARITNARIAPVSRAAGNEG